MNARLQLIATLAAAAASGLASAGAPPTPAAVGEAIERAREAVLAVERRLDTLAADEAPPRVAVYLREPSPDRRLGRVVVSADGQGILERRPGNRPAPESGVTPVLELGEVAPAALGGEIRATGNTDDDEDRRLDGHTRLKGPAAGAEDMIELVVEDGGWLLSPGIEILRWRADPSLDPETGGFLSRRPKTDENGIRRFPPGGRADPRLRHALSVAAAGEAERGLNRLIRLRAGLPPKTRTPDALLWALADTSLDAGLPERARRVLHELAGRKPGDAMRLGQLQLRVGEAYLARGAIDAARKYIGAPERGPPRGLRLEWQDLMSRIHLAAGDQQAAAGVFDDTEALLYEVRRNLRQPGPAHKLAAYSRYNRAVAFIRNGDAQRGRTWLDVVGRMHPFDPETEALRDKANVALGWQLLRTHEGLTATSIFDRVRLDGPFSNAALLGAGWAILGQTGRQSVRRSDREALGASLADSRLPDYVVELLIKRRILDPNVYGQESLRTTFGRTEPPAGERDAARRALQYWLELDEGDIRATAVQEGLLAIAHAYRILGDKAQSAERYRQAAERFERALAELAEARKRTDDDDRMAVLLEDFAQRRRNRRAADGSPEAWLELAVLRDVDSRGLERLRAIDDLEMRITAAIRRIEERPGTATAGDERRAALGQRLQRVQDNLDRARAHTRTLIQERLAQALSARGDRLRGYLKAAYAGHASLSDASRDVVSATP